MSEEILVSIIVPIYNSEAVLSYCLKSIQKQTHCRFEGFLIDDGSTDGSLAIAERFAKEDTRFVVQHIENSGIATAQNIGLSLASGEFITFCDNDDILHPEYIERLLLACLSTKSDIAACKWQHIGISDLVDVMSVKPSSDKLLATPKILTQSARDYQLIFSKITRVLKRAEYRYLNEANWSKLYRRHLFETLRFPDGHFAQDVFVAMDLYLAANQVASIPDVLYYWLQQNSSASHSVKSFAYYEDIYQAAFKNLHLARSKNILPARSVYSIEGTLKKMAGVLRSDEQKQRFISAQLAYRTVKRQLTLRERLEVFLLCWIRRAETFVYDRTLHVKE
ncbi:MAG: glycosyltransferase [Streptococcaceae bacterium]|nr:glycosyltransferase [Streptococcaceae bacterium]